ncbi:MAG: polyphenol oxidase family protein [Proteobacteria bacterium]|nr:polyphenol oxidase family protein [Pseudomonadota bacterium]MBU1233929.1 polyphenol oxidase family protein [Pseudomonadota bacterium]MBU1420296.1 polyphenol oxidase family protein [Pseudomonadota bacterium]MBU1455625.1 polyphenol oxidase family protein [Pseudomonadota bacterium]
MANQLQGGRERGRIIISTDRRGGISRSPYNSLNLSYGVGDESYCVAENRERLKIEGPFTHLLSARQVHGDDIFMATGELSADLEVDGYDSLMTETIGLGLMIQQADCQAVTLYDPRRPAIAAVHCGWKGSVLDILGKTVQAMKDCYRTSPSMLQAYVSPSLGPCCAQFINHARELPPAFLAFQERKNYFNFWKISRMQLLQAGLDADNIILSEQCTSCSADHFSYRRACRQGDGRTGRCATVIGLV